MKKVRFLFALLITLLFSASCNLATYLNQQFEEKLGLRSPAERCVITIYENEESSNKLLLDLGNEYSWKNGSVDVSFEMLMEYPAFSQWYESLDSLRPYNKIGIYNPETGNGVSGESFSVNEREALYVLWDSPLEKVRVYANNGYDLYYGKKDLYYEFPVYVPYGESKVLSYNDLFSSPGFVEFCESLNSTVYHGRDYSETAYPVGFVNKGFIKGASITEPGYYDFNEEIFKSITISKEKSVVRIGWSKIPEFATLIIKAGIPGKKDFIINLEEMKVSHDVSLSGLLSDVSFSQWYNSLEKEGYQKDGLGLNSDDMYPLLKEEYDFNQRLNYSCRVLYVTWKPFFDKVYIHSNNKTDEVFVYEIGRPVSQIMLFWDMVAESPGFLTWYEKLTNGELKKDGLSLSDRYSQGNDVSPAWNVAAQIFGNNPNLYVYWTEPISYITIGADQDTFIFEFEQPDAYILVTWDLLCKNPAFVNWYEKQTRDGYRKWGLRNINSILGVNIIQAIPNDQNTVYVNKYLDNHFEIQWEPAFDLIRIYPGNGTLDIYEFHLKSPVNSIFLNWNDFAEDEGFMQWYNSLIYPGYKPIGLAKYELDPVSCTPDFGSIEIKESNTTIFVSWAQEYYPMILPVNYSFTAGNKKEEM